MTLKEAKALHVGDMVYHKEAKNADGTAQRWKVTGKVKVWKRDKKRVRVPLKRGLREYGYLTEDDLDLVEVEEAGE